MTDTQTHLSSTTPQQPAVVVPDKPALEGLEDKWSKQWEADGVYAFDRTKSRSEVYSIDTPAADRVRDAPLRQRLLLHPVRPHRPLPADARQGGLLPDRLGRQRPAHRAPGAELLRRPLRPVGALRPRLHPAREARPQAAGADRAAELHRALPSSLVAEDEVAFEALFKQVGLSVDWNYLYTTIGDESRATSQRAFLRNLARDEAYLQESPTLWDVTFQTAVAQAELEAREYPGHYYRVAFHRLRRQGSTTGTPVFIETTRPELIPAVVALIAHPDDERYQPLFGTHGDQPGLRRRDPGPRAPGRRARQGRRHRDVLHVRRPHRRAVVARAPAAGPHRDPARRPAQPRDPRVARRRRARRRRTPSWPARPRSPPARRWSDCSARAGDLEGEPEADPADGELLREGRQAARDRLHPASGTSATAAATRTCAARSSSAATRSSGRRPTCTTATRTGSRGSTATG